MKARGLCGGPLSRGEGNQQDESGRWFTMAYTSLNTAYPTPDRFYSCPIHLGLPEANPEITPYLRDFRRFRLVGLTGNETEDTLQAFEILEDEVNQMQQVQIDRQKPSMP